MSTTYVFISHCVRPEDPEETRRQKLELIEFLEQNSFGVFDYAERPGNWRDWLDEIRHQFMNCGCVVYFAKQWPEDNPGVVMIEIGAALIAGKDVFIFCPGQRSGAPFQGYSDGLCSAISAQREIVFSRLEDLLPRLRGVQQARFGGASSGYITLTETFFGRRDGQTDSSLRKTQLAMCALNEHSGLRHLSEDQALNGVRGLWSVSQARALITVKASAAGSVLQPVEHRNGTWHPHPTLDASLLPEEILSKVFTIGFSMKPGCSWLLLFDGKAWRFITQNADLTLQTPAELRRSIRRTFIAEHGDSAQLVFFADGIPFAIHPDKGQITLLSPQDAPSEAPGDFIGSASSTAPARLARIHGLSIGDAFVAGGRVESFPPTADGKTPGLWFHEQSVHLVSWKPLSAEDLLKSLLLASGSIGDLSELNAEKTSGGFSPIPSAQYGVFDWFQHLLHAVNPEVKDLSGVFYNQQETNPLLIVPAVTQGVIQRQKPNPSRYYRFKIGWTLELRERLWNAVGHGPSPI